MQVQRPISSRELDRQLVNRENAIRYSRGGSVRNAYGTREEGRLALPQWPSK
jgi:hypothetical protein